MLLRYAEYLTVAGQVQQMIDFIKAQMEQLTKLQTENAELRNAMRDAIKNVPRPQTLTDKRAWFGIVNQVAYAKGELMKPFRYLLEKKQKYYWDETLQQNFEESKIEIVRQIEIGVPHMI